ncbi:MAG: hypothetical protein WA208_13255 [Thermoanaerobaculia bacterium]
MRRNRPACCSRKRRSIFRSIAVGRPHAALPVATPILLLLLLVLAAVPSHAQTSPFVERPDDDLLLLAVRVENDIVEDALAAYATEKAVLVPLGAISQTIGFAIDVNVASRMAEGFFIRDTRRFQLDVNAASVTVEGRRLPFDRSRVEVHQDDIYVEAGLLDEWFPLRATVDRYASLLTIRGTEPLPLQIRAQRAQQASRSLTGGGDTGPRYPLVPSPYRMLGIPQIDQQVRIFLGSGERSDAHFQYSTLASGDLLGLESTLFLSGDSEELFDESRITAGRVDPDGGLLGPLRAREAMLGEIVFPGADLVAFASSGTGFLISNFPMAQQRQFDRHTFIGDLPLGWEIELYRNDELVGYQQSRTDGRYEFRDVPLLFGLNVFRLVYYGPQGQRRTESQSFNIGDTLTPRGELRYRIAGSRGRTLTERAIAEASYGLSSRISVTQSLVVVGASDRARNDGRYSMTGVRAYWDRIFVHGDVGLSSDGGNIVRGGLQTRMGPVSLALSRAQLNDFRSEMFATGLSPVRARTELRLGGFLPIGSQSFPLTLYLTDDELSDGERRTQVSNVVSATVARTSISNRIDGVLFSGGSRNLPPSSVIGSILVSRFLTRGSFRGELSYGITPAATLQTMAVVAEGRLRERYRGALQLSRTLADGETRLIANLSRIEGPFALGVDAEFSSEGSVAVRLNLGASIARDPFSGRWETQSRPAAASGSLAARVFLDSNANGIWDDGETPLENVGFFVNRSSSLEVTDERGIAILRNLPAHQPVDVSVSTGSFEDPLWVPQKAGVSIIPRSGTTVTVDFPVLITGEVTGTVYVKRDDRTREMGGVQLQLVDANATVVKETRTAYDGFYEITNIAPGTYTLRISPQQAARSGLSSDVQKTVVVTAEGAVIDGLDLTLAPASPIAVAQAEPVVPEQVVPEQVVPEPVTQKVPVAPVEEQPEPPVPTVAPVEPVAAPAEPDRMSRIEAAKQLVAEQRFREAWEAFSALGTIEPKDRYFAAVAAYEVGRYAEAKELLASAIVPETSDANRYAAKIQGAIVWQ